MQRELHWKRSRTQLQKISLLFHLLIINYHGATFHGANSPIYIPIYNVFLQVVQNDQGLCKPKLKPSLQGMLQTSKSVCYLNVLLRIDPKLP